MSLKTKIILGVVGLVVIGLLAFLIYKYASKAGNQTVTTTTTSTTTGHGGLADILGGILPFLVA